MNTTRKFTRNLMAKLPSWMRMSKDPDSIGAQFLNVFGISYEEFEEEMNYVQNNFYIETADVEMVDILYKIPLKRETILDFENNNRIANATIVDSEGQERDLTISKTLRRFYSTNENLPLGFLSREDGYLYLRVDMSSIQDKENPFNRVEIFEASHYNVEYHHVWNAFDEFGYLLGLKRLPLEPNDSFKNRILDVFKNPGSSTREGIKNGLARELGLSRDELKIYKLDESAFQDELVKPDGSPTKRLRDYARRINQKLKFTVDTLNLGEAYWHSLEEENIGIYFLPHIWDIDSSLFETKEFQSGVGYGDDLKVNKPEVDEDTYRNFTMSVSLVGYYEDFEEFFPEIYFQYKIYAEGKILENSYKEEEFKYKIIATEEFDQQYSVRASQEFLYLEQFLFDTKSNFEDIPGTEYINFGKSNEFLNNQTDNLQRLNLYLNTSNPNNSNLVSNLNIEWEDTAGATHNYIFDTRDKWLNPQKNTSGQPMSTVITSSTYYNEEDGGLELGKGNFSEEIKTTSDFMRGRYDTNFILVKDGELKLNFENIKQN